jgi:hypothetical protein
MKPSHYVRPALLLSLVLALPLGRARADDSAPSAPPPAAPSAPETSPADGATPAHHRHMRPGYVLADLTTKLSLTPDQQKTVGKAIEDGRAQMKELRGDASIAQADKRAKVREIALSTRGQIRAALNPDQQKLFDAIPAREGKAAAQGAPQASTPPAQP